jgi:hypothetical protein
LFSCPALLASETNIDDESQVQVFDYLLLITTALRGGNYKESESGGGKESELGEHFGEENVIVNKGSSTKDTKR